MIRLRRGPVNAPAETAEQSLPQGAVTAGPRPSERSSALRFLLRGVTVMAVLVVGATTVNAGTAAAASYTRCGVILQTVQHWSDYANTAFDQGNVIVGSIAAGIARQYYTEYMNSDC